MPCYMIEREIPGASKLTEEELRGITATSNEAVDKLENPYTWCYSFVAGDKIYCVYVAPNEELVREHARRGGFPATSVAQVMSTIDPTTAEA